MRLGTCRPATIPKPLSKFCGDAAHGAELLLRQLAQAEQYVAEGKAFIAQQQRLIVELERDGQDSTETMRLDELFESS